MSKTDHERECERLYEEYRARCKAIDRRYLLCKIAVWVAALAILFGPIVWRAWTT